MGRVGWRTRKDELAGLMSLEMGSPTGRICLNGAAADPHGPLGFEIYRVIKAVLRYRGA